MSETVSPPAATDLTLVERVAKLERKVKRLSASVRIPRTIPDFELAPEWKAELDRRIKEADENPGSGIPADIVFADLREKLAQCRK